MKVIFGHSGERYELTEQDRISLTEHLEYHRLEAIEIISVSVNSHLDSKEGQMMVVYGHEQGNVLLVLTFKIGDDPKNAIILREKEGCRLTA